ncbi:TPA: hypothetical protein U0584_000330 [Streptococcus suis]|nr:hypothetical protein [Streptococcus suis]NQO40617.1 hypothetical protein [Streptococcus suis]NQP23766.1 hypothetical protein [Streptococcus suis]NQP25733.1 hypothetical protein [Streptococcus suis]HEL1737584.1 hypothetical protein [Streptococcus suis]
MAITSKGEGNAEVSNELVQYFKQEFESFFEKNPKEVICSVRVFNIENLRKRILNPYNDSCRDLRGIVVFNRKDAPISKGVKERKIQKVDTEDLDYSFFVTHFLKD